MHFFYQIQLLWSVFILPQHSCLSCIARDSGDVAQLCRAGRTVASSAIFIKAWALHIACGMAVDMCISEAVFECKLASRIE